MNKPLPLIFALSLLSGSAAYAMPVAPLSPPQATLMIQVGGGCGLGVHRGPLGGMCARLRLPWVRSVLPGLRSRLLSRIPSRVLRRPPRRLLPLRSLCPW